MLIICLASCLVAGLARAEQFLAMDVTYVHDYWYVHHEFFSQPADWTSPHNFAQGRAYLRVEVRDVDMPIDTWLAGSSRYDPPDTTATTWLPQTCLFQDAHISSKHACYSSTIIRVTGVGLYKASQDMESMYQYEVIDWTRELMNPMVIGKTQDPSGTAYAGSDAFMRASLIIVAQGDTFEEPIWWDQLTAVPEPDDFPAEAGNTWGFIKSRYR